MDGEGGEVGDRFFIGGHVGTCRVGCEREGWCPGRAHSLNLPVVTVDARQVMAVISVFLENVFYFKCGL